jgi:endonuclease V-like protein UPF0215 family
MASMHIAKKGIRALGIAESFAGRERSVIGGVVMRKDLRIDGFTFTSVSVGGMDATDELIRMITRLERDDLNVVMLSGCVISWFNIIDPAEICRKIEVPVICVTYEDSAGLEDEIMHHFPGDEVRLSLYRKLGSRNTVLLHTGREIYIRVWGMEDDEGAKICDAFTLDGKVPEPVRVARMCARAVMQYEHSLRQAVPPPL